jgi:hypothetical protein
MAGYGNANAGSGEIEEDGRKMVGLGRLELPTSPLSGVRSSHLSYRPNLLAGNILRDLRRSSNNGQARVAPLARIILDQRAPDSLKIAILAGGLGTRLAEEAELNPKPMVEIGGRPILWHILKHYACYGHREFFVARLQGRRDQTLFLDRARLRGETTLRPTQAASWAPNRSSTRNYEDGLSGTGAVARKSSRKRAA